MCRSSTTGSRPWQQPVVPLGLSRTSLCVPPATRIAIQPRSGGTMLPWASAHGSRDTNPTKAPTGRHEPQNSPKTGPSICSASCQNGAIHLCRVVISDFPALTYTNHDHQNSLRRSEQSCPPECARCRLARHPPCSLPIPQPADKSQKINGIQRCLDRPLSRHPTYTQHRSPDSTTATVNRGYACAGHVPNL